jgi:phage terminase large subunit
MVGRCALFLKIMIQATIVFEKNWNAINERNDDGSNRYRYIINRGSSRSSKTFSLIDCHDIYARSYKNKRITIWRDTKTDCKKTVLADMIKRFRMTDRYQVGNVFNKTESIFTYKNGSTVEIHGTDDEETVHGLTQDCAHFNEPYQISRETFDQIDQRTSDFVFIDYNPKKGHWVEDLMKDPRSIVIDSTFKDNPFCPPEQRNKILSYQPVSMCDIVTSGILEESDAMKYNLALNPNEFDLKRLNELIRCRENEDKNSANAFNWAVYGLGEKAERPNRIFKWHPITLTEYQELDAPIVIGCDWGKVDPWAIIEVKCYDGCLYLHERNYFSENQIREKLTTTEQAQINGEEEGIVSWMFNKLNIDKSHPIVADTNRPMKIAMLRRHGWEAFGANKIKNSIVDGIDLLHNLQVYYTNTSENIDHEQENYSYKVDHHGTVLETPEDLDNHTIDAVRYVALYLQSTGKIKLI